MVERRRGPRWLLAAAAVIALGASHAPAPPASRPAPEAPLVGITSTVRKDHATVSLTYARAVRRAGGVPVILPPLPDARLARRYARRLDALVLTGGLDVPPEAYGEKPHPTVKPLPRARWDFERALIAEWLKTDKPLLGVCLGAQMANVVMGGSLIQDIPAQVGRSVVHRKPGGDAFHRVSIEPGSRLRKILGAASAEVASAHHQAVRRVAPGLRVVARSADGVVEALETPRKPWVLLVQWHPERMDEAHRMAIYGALVRACRPAP